MYSSVTYSNKICFTFPAPPLDVSPFNDLIEFSMLLILDSHLFILLVTSLRVVFNFTKMSPAPLEGVVTVELVQVGVDHGVDTRLSREPVTVKNLVKIQISIRVVWKL